MSTPTARATKIRTLRDIIAAGNDRILAGESAHPDAIACMAYQAGLSAGQAHTGQRWLAAIKRGQDGAAKEHCHFVAARHIHGPVTGDGDLYGRESAELMAYEYGRL